MDIQQADALRNALATGRRSQEETAEVLAATYIHCSANTSGEWHAVGAALAGSVEMAAVHQELLDGYVQLFATVLKPHTILAPEELERRCVGLVAAGEALSATMVRGNCSEAEAVESFTALVLHGLHVSSRRNRTSK